MSVFDKIKEKFILPNAYEEWKEYRSFLTGVAAGYGNNKQKTVAVIGAGRCNDIDVSILCQKFAAVTLIDYDMLSMQEGIASLSDDEKSKVELMEFSLTGIKEKDLKDFCENILDELRRIGSGLTYSQYKQLILKEIEELSVKRIKEKKDFISLLPGRDIVVCNAVFSQLFSMLLFFIKSVTVSVSETILPEAIRLLDVFEEEFRKINDAAVPFICDALVEMSNEYVIFGNEYSEKCPIEGAYQCITANRRRNDICEEQKVKWLFNKTEHIEYEMLVQVCGRY